MLVDVVMPVDVVVVVGMVVVVYQCHGSQLCCVVAVQAVVVWL